MKILEALLPIISLIIIGMICRRAGILNESGTIQIRNLIGNILLPVLIIDSLGNGKYNTDTALNILIIFLLEILALSLGYLLKPLAKKNSRHLLPIITGSAEGGMFGYPLFIILCGYENLSYLVKLDIALAIFTFSIWSIVVRHIDSGERPRASSVLKATLKNPCVWAVVIGILVGVTGFMNQLTESPMGILYSSVQGMIAEPIGALILIIIGYDLKFKSDALWESLQMLLIRLSVQALIFGIAWLLIGRYAEPYTQIALIFFFTLPATFVAQIYAKDPENRRILSAFSSINSLFTIIAFAILTLLYDKIIT